MGRNLRLGAAARPLSLAVLVVASCTYDWTVGPSEAGGGTREAGGDSSSEASGGCDEQLSRINYARSQVLLLLCDGISTCAEWVKDQCDCRISVVGTQNPTVENFVSLVAQYQAAGCHDGGCGSCANSAYQCIGDHCV
jgi:hypothetical protein